MAKIEITYSDKQKKELEKQETLIRYTIDKFEKEKFPKYISNYKQYLWYTLDRMQDIEDWQTNITYPLIASVVDTMFANLFDFNFVFHIQEEKLKELCMDTFDYKSQWKNALKWALKECIICWEWFTQTWIRKKTEEYSFLRWKYKTSVVTKKPTLEFTSIFNVFYDDSYGITDSRYQITRVFNTWEYIKEKYSALFDDKKTNERNIIWYINKILNTSKANKNRFSNFDYNPVKRINNYSTALIKAYKNWASISTLAWITSETISQIDENNFYLVDDKQSYEIVEYMCEWVLTVYIDWIMLYNWEPVIDWELTKIRWIVFNEIPWAWNANWQVDNLSDLQNILNGIWNWFLDNMKMQLSWMFTVTWNVPALSRDGKLKFKKFQAIKLTPDSSINRLDLWLNDFSPINTAQFIEWIWEKRAWVNSYLLWGQSKVERVSDSINLIHDQYKSKLTPIIDSVQIMMWGVAKAWILIYLKHFTEKELNKLWINFEAWEEWLMINWILVEDIIRDEAISFKFNSLRNIEKEKKRWIIKEIFMQLIQVKQFKPEQIDELFKILLDEDFDLNTFKWFWFKEEAWIEEWLLNWIDEEQVATDTENVQLEQESQDPAELLKSLWL